MAWTHLLAATDGSPAGAHAVGVARGLADHAGARLTVVTVVSGPDATPPDLPDLASPVTLCGVPGVEITRFADQVNADLLVLGRHLHPDGAGPRLGPTADAVVRRSRIPCLFVPVGQDELKRHVVALDGTERGFAVLPAALELVALVGGRVEVVTVEPEEAAGSLEVVPWARALRVREAVDHLGGSLPGPIHSRVLTGDPVFALRGAVRPHATDVLALGARRGGVAGVPRSTGVGRLLLFSVQCAVLTIPL